VPQLFLNNFQTQFIASVKAAPDSASPALELDYGVLRVSDGAAGLLLNPGAGNWYVLTAFKRSGSAESDYEVLRVTAVDNAVIGECRLTVLRGQEGTTPKSYVAGDLVELRLTAGGMGQYVQTADARLTNPRAPTGAAGGVLSGSYPNPGFAQAMATAADLSGKVDKVAGKGLSANDYTNADLAKLAGIAEQATKNATDAALRDRASHTGAQAIATVTGLQAALDAKAPGSHVGSGGAAHAAATNAAAGFMSAADKVKLDSVAASATANATDEVLRTRANHTGTQALATIDGLQSALDQKVDVVAGKGLSSADFTAAEKTKLSGIAAGAQVNVATNLSVTGRAATTFNVASSTGAAAALPAATTALAGLLQSTDKAKLDAIAAGATANSTDASLRARANHTGTQAISTVADLQATLDGKQAALASGVNIKTVNGQSLLGSGDIVVSANPDLVRRPTNVAPAQGVTGVLETPIFDGGVYYSLYGIPMGGSNWQVSTSANFDATVVDWFLTNSETTFKPPEGVLNISVQYYWRVRYKDIDGVWSPWSAVTSFTTAAFFISYIPTPAPTPSAFGEPFQAGFYAGMIWNEVVQSSTSFLIGIGEKVFAVPNMQGASIVYGGQTLEIRSRANPANKMIGVVTDARGSALTINVTSVTGSGTFSDWSIMASYRIILAPKASGELVGVVGKNANTAAPAACTTLSEGRKATAAMVAADSATVYPAAHFCNNLSIGGYSDWYWPARDELELVWRNLKMNTAGNNNSGRSPANGQYLNLGSFDDAVTGSGANRNSNPAGALYTASLPTQTAATIFRVGGPEVMTAAYYWSSSQYNNIFQWIQGFFLANGGAQNAVNKNEGASTYAVRAVRRSII